MDRAHRLGQTRTVNVYRLLMAGTLEEKIMGLQQFKMDMANTVSAALNELGLDGKVAPFCIPANFLVNAQQNLEAISNVGPKWAAH